jgi:hypothetical protein
MVDLYGNYSWLEVKLNERQESLFAPHTSRYFSRACPWRSHYAITKLENPLGDDTGHCDPHLAKLEHYLL